MKTVIDVVSDKLNKYMGEQNLTQYKIAQKSGIPYSTIKNIMQRRTKSIDFKTVLLLSHGLGIRPQEFVDDDFLPEKLNLD